MLTIIFLIFFLVSLKYAWWAPSIDLKHTRIMMYHMISEQLNSGKKSGLRVSPDMFEKQLKWFTDNNWKFIKMSEIEKYKDHEKVVAITFDDGYEDNYLKALPLLKNIKLVQRFILFWIEIIMTGQLRKIQSIILVFWFEKQKFQMNRYSKCLILMYLS